MNEVFLQFLWHNGLFGDKFAIATSGEPVEIIQVGEQNTDSGPDFVNARIRIGNTLWVGNVEIHQKSYDWFRHGHHTDPAFDNVILHVVLEHDTEVRRPDGEIIPSVILDVDKALLNRYLALMNNRRWIPCQDFFPAVDGLVVDLWLNKLMIGRIEQKAEDILSALRQQQNDWDEVFYQKLARSFGYGINTGPFELLAKRLPLRLIAKHRDQLIQIEAMIFGQAGFLEKKSMDDYHEQLRKEYAFLKKKYSLTSMAPHLWKHLRLRPVNFPSVRMAQFAALLHQHEFLFEQILKTEDVNTFHPLLFIPPSPYWQHHYDFGKPSKRPVKGLGEEMRNIIIANLFVPFVYLTGKQKNRPGLQEKAVQWLECMPPENNTVTRRWETLGVNNRNASVSQALIHLKKEYCDHRRCLACQVGKAIIACTR